MAKKKAWVKLYRDHSTRWTRLPPLTRGLGFLLLAYTDDQGRVWLQDGVPVHVGIGRLVGASPQERRGLRRHVDALLAHGFVELCEGGLRVPEFGRYQARGGRAAETRPDPSGPPAVHQWCTSGPPVVHQRSTSGAPVVHQLAPNPSESLETAPRAKEEEKEKEKEKEQQRGREPPPPPSFAQQVERLIGTRTGRTTAPWRIRPVTAALEAAGEDPRTVGRELLDHWAHTVERHTLGGWAGLRQPEEHLAAVARTWLARRADLTRAAAGAKRREDAIAAAQLRTALAADDQVIS